MKKWVAVFCLLAALMLTAVAFSSTPQEQLEGTWRMEGPVEGTVDIYLTFGQDGKLSSRYNAIRETTDYQVLDESTLQIGQEHFSYTIAGSRLTLSFTRLISAEEKDQIECPYTIDGDVLSFEDKTYTFALDETGKKLLLTQGDAVLTYTQSSKRKDITTGTWTLAGMTVAGVEQSSKDISESGAYIKLRLKKPDDEGAAAAILTPAVLESSVLNFRRAALPEDTPAPEAPQETVSEEMP